MKKIVASCLVLVLILGFASTAMAATPRGGAGFRGGTGDMTEPPRFNMEANTPRGGAGFRGGAANMPEHPRRGMEANDGIGFRGVNHNFFYDADGNFLSIDAALANLDSAVANGNITIAQKEMLLERYDYRIALGDNMMDVRRGVGRGFGAAQLCPWAE